jgi:ketosteroid isomerase-like protein
MLSRLAIAASIVCASACRPRPDAEAERAALLRTDRVWSVTAHAGTDVEGILAYWSDDARVYPPEMPVVDGKAAIRAFVTGSLRIPGFSVSWEPHEAVISPDGRFGYTTGVNSFTAPDARGKLVTTPGRYVTVWRKAPDGSWKCVIDFWNSGPTPSTTRTS